MNNNATLTGNQLNWDKINTVVLDLDGTLLDLHFDNYFWLTHLPMRYAQAHNLDTHEATTALTKLIKQYEGTLNWYCLDHWSDLVKMDIPSLKREITHKIQTRPHTEAFLQFLRTKKKKVILATNAHRKGLEIKLDTTQIDHYMDIIVSSHDYAQPKESEHFWTMFFAREQVTPEHAIFVDDNVQVLRAANAFPFHKLICINRPDSQKPSTKSNEFMDIDDFDEIMPGDHGKR